MSRENFKLSETNPNDSIGGGGCLCSPEKEAGDCQGPYVVFHLANTDAPRSPHVVVSETCLNAAQRQLRDRRGDIPSLGRPVDTIAKINAPGEPNTEWDDLTPEQCAAARHFPAGSVVKVAPNEYVVVPAGANDTSVKLPPPPDTAESVQSDQVQGEDPLVSIAGGALPLEEPGSTPGAWVPAEVTE